ncbi:hypothetical protein OU798_20775 [Prolixibacteraceae bacterium Z1-6]|uniref:Uncharacterized protein n=1 Tax=Draconibacterium aestuarii TaxID=2998507 RepID=A0A9X3F912_9BACT|nr:hypothetical protein [Prolixibacteraceae bacterium Z1-6]
MNKVKMFLNCVSLGIKKIFFKGRDADISHTCVKLKEMAEEVNSIEELKLTEEYALKYSTTTRWQTL